MVELKKDPVAPEQKISEEKVNQQCEAMQRLASQVRSLLVRLLLKRKDDK